MIFFVAVGIALRLLSFCLPPFSEVAVQGFMFLDWQLGFAEACFHDKFECLKLTNTGLSYDQILRMNVVKKGKGKKVKKTVKQQEQSFGFAINLDEEEPELPQQSPIIDTVEDFKIIEVVRTEMEQPEPPSHSQTSQILQSVTYSAQSAAQAQMVKESRENSKIEEPAPMSKHRQFEEEHKFSVDLAVQQPLNEEKEQEQKPLQTVKKELKPLQNDIDAIDDEAEAIVEPTITSNKLKKQSSKPSNKKKTTKPKSTKTNLRPIILDTQLYQPEEESTEPPPIITTTIAQVPNNENLASFLGQQQERVLPSQMREAKETSIEMATLHQHLPKGLMTTQEEIQNAVKLQPELVVVSKQQQQQRNQRIQAQVLSKNESAPEHCETEELELAASVNISKKGKKGKKKETKPKKSAISFSSQMFVQPDILEESDLNEQHSVVPIETLSTQMPTELAPAQLRPTELATVVEAQHKQDECQPEEAPNSITVEAPRQELEETNITEIQAIAIGNIAEKTSQFYQKISQETRKQQITEKVQTEMMAQEDHQTIVDNIILSVAKKKLAKKDVSKKATKKNTSKQHPLHIALLQSLELQQYQQTEPSLVQNRGEPLQPQSEQEQPVLQSQLFQGQFNQQIAKASELQSRETEQRSLAAEPLAAQPYIDGHIEFTQYSAKAQELTKIQTNDPPAPVQQEFEHPSNTEQVINQPDQQLMAEALSLNMQIKAKKTTKKNPKGTTKSKNTHNKTLFSLNLGIAEQTQQTINLSQPRLHNKIPSAIESSLATEQPNKPASPPHPSSQLDTGSMEIHPAFPIKNQILITQDSILGNQFSIDSHSNKLDHQLLTNTQSFNQNQTEQLTLQHRATQPQQPSLVKMQELSICDGAVRPELHPEREREQERDREKVEDIVLVAQISKPNVKGTKKGNKKAGEKSKALVKETRNSSPFPDIELQIQSSLHNTQPLHPYPLLPSLPSQDKASGSATIQDRQVPQVSSKEQERTQLGTQSKALQTTENPYNPKLRQVSSKTQISSRTQIMRQLVELVNIQGDHEVRCIKERLQMLEEDIRSRLRRKHEQVLNNRDVSEVRTASDKARIYSAIISENIALRDQMRSRQ